ncbi:MAG: hypothetical protein R3B69_00810 [Candidatus Paceibacterota bacterium]
MSEVEKQESQKTIVAFVAGLLVGGLLVWVFSADNHKQSEMSDEMNDSTSTMVDESADSQADTDDMDTSDTTNSTRESQSGDASIEVRDQAAGNVVAIEGAVYPNDEGWMGVKDYNDGQLSGLLGVARFSKEQGLTPTEVELLRATEAGKQYAIVYFTENGDREFSLATDVQIDDVVAVFTAR